MVYVLANPVAAGLVRRGREWPGVWSDPSRIGGEAFPAERPKDFFREAGPMPASAELRLDPPPGFEDDASFAKAVADALEVAEDAAAVELGRNGRSFLGVARVLVQSPNVRPAPGEPRRTLSPRVACKNKWRRIEVLQRMAEFARAYREARDAWRAGLRETVFPQGTWLMRVQHAVRCASCA